MSRTINTTDIYLRDAYQAARKGTKDDLTHQFGEHLPSEAEACREATRAGFVAFYRYVCNLEPAKHMAVWIDELITEEDSDCLVGIAGPDTDILAPRGSAKSTFTTFFIAWILGIHYGPSVKLPLQVMILSYSQENACQKSDEIRTIIKSERYKEVFPWVQPSKESFGRKSWMLDKIHAGIDPIGSAAYTVITAGIAGAIVSKRTHLVVIDDIIKSFDAIANPTIREKMETNWDSGIRPTLMNGGRCLCLGTRFRSDDMHCTRFIPSLGWLQLEQSAIVEWTDPEDEDAQVHRFSYWPEKYSLSFLEKFEKESPIHFKYQYQNTISHAQNSGIQGEWLLYDIPPAIFDFIGIGIDLATGKTRLHDYTVFTLGARRGNRYFILDMRRGRWTGNITKLDKLLEMLSIWGIIESEPDPEDPSVYRYYSTAINCYMFAEKNAYQGSLKGDFQSYVLGEHGITNLMYKGVASKVNKELRFNGITGMFENRQVYLNRYAKLDPLVTELTNVGTTQFDDCRDSCVLLLDGLRAKRMLQSI